MATRLFTRSLLTTKQTLSSVLSRSYTSGSLSTPSSSLSSLSILRLRPLVALAANFHRLSPGATTVRGYATRRTSSSLNDPNPNWSNRPPKETILLDGCDFEHWLVVMEKPEGDPTRDDIIDSYIKTLAEVVGSEDEARMKIYSVSTRHYFAFGALVSEELSYKLKELPRVRWVLPDSYLDVRNKDYGGEPFINGQAVPYDPKYHEEWVRNNAKANDRNRRNDRPRNFDRSRNFERRRENMQNPSGMASPPPGNMGGQPIMGGMPQTNMGGGMPPHNMGGGPPPHMGGGPPPYNVGGGPPPHNMGAAQPPPPHNMGAAQPPYNMGGGQPPYNVGGAPPPHNMGGGQPPHNMGGGQPPYNVGGAPPPYVGGGQPPHNMGGGMPQNNMGGNPQYNTGRTPQNNMGGPPNPMGVPPNNMGGPPNPVGGGLRNTAPPNFQYGPNSGGMPPQNREMSGPGQNREYQHNNFAPNMNPNQTQDMPGRDMPPPPNYQ